MDRDEIVALIRVCLDAISVERGDGRAIPLGEETVLLGDDSALDSLEFVSFATDLEGRLARRVGREVPLVADAMSGGEHPFGSVGRLADHIAQKLRR